MANVIIESFEGSVANVVSVNDGGGGTWSILPDNAPYNGSFIWRLDTSAGSHQVRFDSFVINATRVQFGYAARYSGKINPWQGGSAYNGSISINLRLWNETKQAFVPNSDIIFAPYELGASGGSATVGAWQYKWNTVYVTPGDTYKFSILQDPYSGGNILNDIDYVVLNSEDVTFQTGPSNQTKVDRFSNGNIVTGWPDDKGTIDFQVSTDNGKTFNSAGTASQILQTARPSFFIDQDDYLHVVWKQWGTSASRTTGLLYYMRGTPNATRTSWTWNAAAEVLYNATTGSFGPSAEVPDIVAHRNPANPAQQYVHVAVSYVNGTDNRPHLVTRLINADGTYATGWGAPPGSTGADLTGGISQGNAVHNYPSVDFNHTGDGKTIAGNAPHIWIAWSAGVRGTNLGVRISRYTWGGTSWTSSAAVTLSTAHAYIANDARSIKGLWDGTRYMVGGYLDHTDGTTRQVLFERDSSNTTTTTRVDFTPADGSRPYWGTCTYDKQGNWYWVAGSHDSDVFNRLTVYKWDRIANTTSAVAIFDGGHNPPIVSAKRGSGANSSIEWIYIQGDNYPKTVKYDKLLLSVVPNAPVSVAYVYEAGQNMPLVNAYLSSASQAQPILGRFSIYAVGNPTALTTFDSAFRTGDGSVSARSPITLAPGDYIVRAIAVNDNAEASGPSADTSFSIYTVVGNAVNTPWNVRAIVPDTANLVWNVRATTATTGAQVWNTYQAINKTNNELWNVRAVVGKSNTQYWTVRVPVFVTQSQIWSQRTSLFTTEQFRWNQTALVGKSVNTLWGQGGTVAVDFNHRWTTRATTSTTQQQIWNVRTTVPFKSYATTWHVRALVGQNRNQIWNTRAVTANTSNQPWNVRSVTFKTEQQIWNVRYMIPQSRNTIWNVRANIFKTNQQIWTVRTKLFTTDQYIWNSRLAIGNEVNLRFRTISLYSQIMPSIPDYYFEVLDAGPLGYWRMDEPLAGTFPDSSGFNRNLTYTGTVIDTVPLITGGRAKDFIGSAYGTTNIDSILIRGQETKPFTIEAWVEPDALPTTERLIVGRGTDGLFVIPEGFEFRITNSLGQLFKAPFVVNSWGKRHHVVATFGGNEMYMFVDGKASAPKTFSGYFNNTSDVLYVGGAPGATGDTTLDEVAIYGQALYNTMIGRHYFYGIKKPNYEDVVTSEGGIYWPLNDQMANVTLDYEMNNADGALALAPITHQWVSDLIDVGQLGVIDGSRLDWESTNDDILVETSMDLGVTWSAAVKHQTITGLAVGTNATDKFLQIRATLTNLTGNYAAYLDRIHAVVYGARQSRSVNYGVPADVGGNVSLAERDYNAMSEYMPGAKIQKQGRIVLPSLTAEAPAKTLEFWVRVDLGAGGVNPEYIVDARTALTAGTLLFNINQTLGKGAGWNQAYVNGVLKTPVASDLPVGEWVHIVLISNTGWVGPVFLGQNYSSQQGSNISIAHPALYPTALTSAQVNRHTVAGYSKNYSTVLDPDFLNITEGTPRVYARKWEMVNST